MHALSETAIVHAHHHVSACIHCRRAVLALGGDEGDSQRIWLMDAIAPAWLPIEGGLNRRRRVNLCGERL